MQGRNPLKSGQCFLQPWEMTKQEFKEIDVAIPSNRVNVSYLENVFTMSIKDKDVVAIPSNRVNVSYL